MNGNLNDNKACTRCGNEYPRTGEFFHREKRSPDGLKSVCKLCRNGNGVSHRLSIGKAALHGKVFSQSAKFTQPTNSAVLPVKTDWSKRFLVLPLLFTGGFCLSTLNGSFAFVDITAILSNAYSQILSIAFAAILTLGTSVTSFYGFVRKSTLAIILFVLIQTLNLSINWTGVQKAQQKIIQKQHSAEITRLEQQKQSLLDFVQLYPTTDKSGRPVSWKHEITEQVLDAHNQLQHIEQQITDVQFNRPAQMSIDRLILTLGFLLTPELCILAAIIGLANTRKN